jgi:hypothetical protein
MAKKPIDEFEYLEGTGDAKALLIDQVLWALHLHGPFEDRENGRATALVADWLEEQGVRVPTTLSVVIRDLTTDDWGGYVVRDCPATRTYSIELAKGIRPGKVPFPPNPFSDMEEDANVVPISVKQLASAGDSGPTPDASTEGRYDAVAIALEITGLAAQLVRELPAQIAPPPDTTPEWVKQLVTDNAELRAEVQRLQVALQAAEGLANTLLPGDMEQSETGAAVSG